MFGTVQKYVRCPTEGVSNISKVSQCAPGATTSSRLLRSPIFWPSPLQPCRTCSPTQLYESELVNGSARRWTGQGAADDGGGIFRAGLHLRHSRLRQPRLAGPPSVSSVAMRAL